MSLFPQSDSYGTVFDHIPVQASTFKGGLEQPVHNWFRLTPSYGPGLVRHALKETGTNLDHVVFDPFSGAGTTLIEAALMGHRVLGHEINPMLHFVCRVSTSWSLKSDRLRKLVKKLQSEFSKTLSELQGCSIEESGYSVPCIHNVYRWWNPDVLLELLVLKESIGELDCSASERDFLHLALAGVLVPDLTNVTLGKLQLHFTEKDSADICVWGAFESKIDCMISDVSDLSDKSDEIGMAEVVLADSTDGQLYTHRGIDRVVTSPPYPNRYSYVWNTRPHLYFFDFFGPKKSEASDLDKKTIGGTWGTATSMLSKGVVEPRNEAVERVVGAVIDEIREQDSLMANYAMKYFNLLHDQLAAQDLVLNSGAKLAYVVGCSRLKGVYVETDRLLADMFNELDLGYRATKVERFRRRHSGIDLFESIVYAEKD